METENTNVVFHLVRSGVELLSDNRIKLTLIYTISYEGMQIAEIFDTLIINNPSERNTLPKSLN